MKNENFCRFMILVLLLSSMSPLLQFTGVDLVDTAKAEILDDFQTGWDHYAQFTIDHDFIDEDLTGFPVLVVINSTIAAASNNGKSLRFLSNDLTELYYHEIDLWNAAGDSYIWVRVNHTSSTEDTNVVMFYGNATAPDIQSRNTWDANYTGVWHLNQGATSTQLDNSTYINDAAFVNVGADNALVPGVIGNCIQLNNGGDYYLTGNVPSLNFTAYGGTIEAWIYVDAFHSYEEWFSKGPSWWFFTALSGVRNYAALYTNAGGGGVSASGFSMNGAAWNYFAGYIDPGRSKLMINETLSSYHGGSFILTSTGVGIGRRYQAGREPDGRIDECRVSNIRRSDAWIKASYNSGRQTTGFFTWNGGIDSAVVDTNESSNVGATYATLDGYIRINGSKTTSAGFRWGNSSGIYNGNVTVSSDIANGTEFSYSPSQLNDSRDYYWQAWASNSGGFSTGAEKTFRTLIDYANYSYQSPFLINRSFIDEHLYNFPILVAINSTVAPLCDGGNSIRFSTPEGQQFYHEIDTWNPAATSYVWVNITHIVPYWNTSIIMYYGNSSATSTNSTKTWNDDYLGVWHMNNNGAGTGVNDSTSNGNTAVKKNTPTQVAGRVGYGQDLDKNAGGWAADYLNLTDAISPEIQTTNQYTIEGWIDRDATTTQRDTIFSEWGGATNALHFGALSVTEANVAFARILTGPTARDLTDTTPFGTEWGYTATTYDTDMQRLYVNDTQRQFAVRSPLSINAGGAWQGHFGLYLDGLYGTQAILDEIRISKTARSTSWLNASYNTVVNQSSFILWGGIQAPAVGTNAATSILVTSATLNGILVKNGAAVTSYGIRYGTDADDLSNNHTVGAAGANDTSFSYSGTFEEGTLYYFQAWASNNNGFSVGNIQTFWTNSIWANPSLTYRRKITIENEGFICEDLINFPILVAINGTSIGFKCNNGSSIRFYKNNTEEYYYDIDTWNNTTSYVWVNVTHVYDDANTVFYMHYNSSVAVNSESNLTWNAEYLGVYHLNETGGVRCNDSSRYGYNNGTYCGNLPTREEGEVGYAQHLDGTDDWINFPPGCWLTGDNFGTYEVYVKHDTITASQAQVYIKQIDTLGNNYVDYGVNNSANNRFNSSSAAAGVIQWNFGAELPLADTWYYASLPMEKNNVQLMIDDSVIIGDTSCNMPNTPVANMHVIRFGDDQAGGASDFDGLVDEIRISSIARSTSWLEASSHSIHNTTGFFTFGDEELILGIQTNDPIAVYTQNATLSGTLLFITEPYTTVRFQLNNSSVSYLTGRNTKNQTLIATGQFTNNTSLPPLNIGERYWYRAYGNDSAYESFGETKSFLTQPNASSGLVLTQGGLQITLTWTNNTGGDGCYIEYSENVDPGPAWAPLDATPVPGANLGYETTPYVHTALNFGSTYYYKLWAYAEDDGWRSTVGNTSAPLNQTGITGNALALGINVTTNATTGVEEMNATMWGWLNYSAYGFATCRFQYNNTTAFDINTTNQTITSGDTFSQNVSGLTPGMLYHYRAYANDSSNDTTGAPIEFLTKPNASTNLVISIVGGGDNGFNISWTNNTGCNQTIVVRNNTSTPTDPYDGWEIYNGTNQSFIDVPLTGLHTYYYRIWAYASWTWDGVDYHQFSDGDVSASRTYVTAPVIIFNSTNVLSTTATLNMYFDGAGTTYQIGWWVSCVDPTLAAPGLNLSDTTTDVPGFYTYSATGLLSGQYYHIRAWASSATEFLVTPNASYMIMNPNPPTSLQSSAIGGNSIQLNWVRFSPPACIGGSVSNRTTVIRYSTTIYPVGATGENGTATGTWLYNGTANNYIHSGLAADTTYYYSMWTYVNDSGSPMHHAWSSYSTVSAGTEGGNYTITIRYENISYKTIPLTRGVYHKFNVHYADRTEFNFWDGSGNLITTGTYANESTIISINPASGTFTFNAPSRPLWMEFHWNETDGMIYRCNRIIVPQSGQRNVTFYLRIDLPVFRETVFTINGTLVKYAYTFVDETGFYDTESNALAEIFFYNSTGTKIIVHREYWDTELKMYPWLVYAKKYFMGVYCDDVSVANLGIAPSEQNEEPQIIIPFSYIETHNFFDYIVLTFWWQDSTTLGFTYLDTDYSSTNVTLNLYWWNNTLISTNYYNDLSNFNHFWVGLNDTYSYKVEVITVNDIWPDGLSSQNIPIYGIIRLSVTHTTVDNVMETMFGKSPLWMQNIDGTEREVPWSQVIIFGVAFILLVTLGKLNAFLGMSVTGGWLLFSSVAITGVQLAGGAALAVVGLFLIALSIIGLLGGVERR